MQPSIKHPPAISAELLAAAQLAAHSAGYGSLGASHSGGPQGLSLANPLLQDVTLFSQIAGSMMPQYADMLATQHPAASPPLQLSGSVGSLGATADRNAGAGRFKEDSLKAAKPSKSQDSKNSTAYASRCATAGVVGQQPHVTLCCMNTARECIQPVTISATYYVA